MRILTFKLLLILCFSTVALSTGQLFAQDDNPFDIGIDDWPDEPMDDFPDDEPEVPEPATKTAEPKVEEKPKTTTSTPMPDPKPVTSQPVPEPAPAVSNTPKEKPSEPVQEKPKPVETVTSPAPAPSEPAKSSPPEPVSAPAYKPVVTPSPVQSSGGSGLKRSGAPLLLISRPVFAPYSTEGKTMYIAAISEAYFHFKLGALPGILVVPQEKIANNVQYFRDFSRRISRTSYLEAAKKVGATYFFYQEYEPQGKKVKFNLELYSITENKKLTSSTQTFDIADLENGLFDCIGEVATALVGSIPSDIQQILAMEILGKNNKAIESFGDKIASVGDFSQKRAEAAVSDYEKIVNQNAQMHVARFVTASACARAQQFEKAINHQRKLISTMGSSYPALSLQLASYYRQAGKFNDALDAADDASKDKLLEIPAKIELAHIYESKGDLNRAKSEYLSVLDKGGEDGEVYFQLALVSIGLNNLSQSSEYLSKAASAGRELDRGDYYDLGLRYMDLGSANDKAIESFKASLGIQQDNEDAWRQLADLYSKMGNNKDAAECYISLFHINNTAYKDYLPKAGMMYESLGEIEEAKEAYELFLARRYVDPEVSVRLAKLELQSGRCDKAVELVNGLDTNAMYSSDVRKINDQCGKPERRVVIPTDMADQGNWRGVFFWRVISGVITVGAAGLGYYCDMQVADTKTKYLESKNPSEVPSLHDDLEKFQLYRNISYAGAAVGATSFTLSIALPIIISRK